MKAHEDLLIFGPIEEAPDTLQIFYKKLPTYNPQMSEGHAPVHSYTKHTDDGSNYGKTKTGISGGGSTKRYPRDVLKYKWDTQSSSLHPTQKPIDLLMDIIKTYTNEGNVVLDNCVGSGSTIEACLRTGRHYIGHENDITIFNIAQERTKRVKEELTCSA